MTHDRAVVAARPVFAGWRIMRSDAGRFWATRERPFPRAVEDAGAHRTVDADDLVGLCQVIAEQESIAEQKCRIVRTTR
ncbi:hypothetical protein [Nonomuraea sp. C10]|uniref:hypothetical protein n=1 Tax=Nonomuraea sp. C10 TaxID=2600577 RepID=UPI0011CD4C74|nr:hypothetical protein [Nonomuraea sp. C10]TXK43293.1 hypothetical protein FR742_30235 [Nonomuraea sp. C10]